jgi:hypothetical protein
MQFNYTSFIHWKEREIIFFIIYVSDNSYSFNFFDMTCIHFRLQDAWNETLCSLLIIVPCFCFFRGVLEATGDQHPGSNGEAGLNVIFTPQMLVLWAGDDGWSNRVSGDFQAFLAPQVRPVRVEMPSVCNQTWFFI